MSSAVTDRVPMASGAPAGWNPAPPIPLRTGPGLGLLVSGIALLVAAGAVGSAADAFASQLVGPHHPLSGDDQERVRIFADQLAERNGHLRRSAVQAVATAAAGVMATAGVIVLVAAVVVRRARPPALRQRFPNAPRQARRRRGRDRTGPAPPGHV